MNRTELVDAVATETGLERRQAEAAVKAFSEAVIAETRSGSKVSIFGFGTFTPTERAARMGRNPQTNTPVKIAASKGVRFSPAAAFKSTLNTKKAAAKKTAAKKTTASKTSATKSPASTTAAKATSARSSRSTAGSTTPTSRSTSAPAPAKKASAKKASAAVKTSAAKATKAVSATKR